MVYTGNESSRVLYNSLIHTHTYIYNTIITLLQYSYQHLTRDDNAPLSNNNGGEYTMYTIVFYTIYNRQFTRYILWSQRRMESYIQ